jgi:hypothetical protein
MKDIVDHSLVYPLLSMYTEDELASILDAWLFRRFDRAFKFKLSDIERALTYNTDKSKELMDKIKPFDMLSSATKLFYDFGKCNEYLTFNGYLFMLEFEIQYNRQKQRLQDTKCSKWDLICKVIKIVQKYLNKDK